MGKMGKTERHERAIAGPESGEFHQRDPERSEASGSDDVGQRLLDFDKYLRVIFFREHVRPQDIDDLVQATLVRMARRLHKGVRLPDCKDDLKCLLAAHARFEIGDYRRRFGGRGEEPRPTMIEFGDREPECTSGRGRSRVHRFSKWNSIELKKDELLEAIRVEAGDGVADATELSWWGYDSKEIAKTLNRSVRTITRYLADAETIVRTAFDSKRELS